MRSDCFRVVDGLGDSFVVRPPVTLQERDQAFLVVDAVSDTGCENACVYLSLGDARRLSVFLSLAVHAEGVRLERESGVAS